MASKASARPDALAIALGEGADELALDLGQPAAFEDIVDAFAALPAVDALDAGAEVEVFVDAHFFIEGAAFGHVADLGANGDRVPENIEPGDGGAAGGRGEIASQDAHGGGFARPVGAEEADDLAGRHVEADVADRGIVAIVFRQIADVNQGPPQARR